MKLFGLNIGKKSDGATAEAPPKVKAEKPKKEKAPKPAKAAAKAKPSRAGGELNVYTGVLLAALIVLGAGAAMIAMTNLEAVAGTADEGNPFAVASGR